MRACPGGDPGRIVLCCLETPIAGSTLPAPSRTHGKLQRNKRAEHRGFVASPSFGIEKGGHVLKNQIKSAHGCMAVEATSPPPPPPQGRLGIAHRAEQRGEKGKSRSSSEGSGPAVSAEPLRVPQNNPESGSEKWKDSPPSYEGEGREMPGRFFGQGPPSSECNG